LRRYRIGAGLCLVQLEIANIFYQQGEYQMALAELDVALTLAPDDGSRARVRHNLGSVAYSQGAYETAVAHFQVALSAAPGG
jgi:tetratricopeptide (TPR) repeat protein